jgi:hypothetical protein
MMLQVRDEPLRPTALPLHRGQMRLPTPYAIEVTAAAQTDPLPPLGFAWMRQRLLYHVAHMGFSNGRR